MSRVLLIGVGPMPHPTMERVHATGLRLRSFLDALRAAEHTIFLAEIPFGGGHTPHVPLYESHIYAHRRLEGEPSRMVTTLNGWLKDFEPDCIIALTDIGATVAARCDFPGPLHVDFFGHPMAERQQQAHVHGSDASVGQAWLTILPALLRADRFSVCSPSQRLALIGELGAAGRLNSHTCGKQLVDIVPPALPFRTMHQPKQKNYLQRAGVPEDARIIFSSGGFNTWLDEETLFRGVEAAMKADPRIHFVATGGAIDGHVNIIFERFTKRIASSAEGHRFHMLGWLQHEQLLDAMVCAHVGVNADVDSLEGELGCRNRLLGWLWHGMRVVTSVTSEPAGWMARSGYARSFPVGDWQQLGRVLAEEAALGRYSDLRELHQVLEQEWGSGRELESSILDFARTPRHAPDRPKRLVENPLTDLLRQLLEEQERQQGEVSVRSFARSAGRQLLGSRLYRLAARVNPKLTDLARGLAEL